MAAKHGWKIYHFDVKSAFLNGLLDEDIYVKVFKFREVKIKSTNFEKLSMA